MPPRERHHEPSGAGLLLGVLQNPNLRRAELSYGASIVAATAWIALLLVLTFRAAGPVGPGIFVLIRTFVGAFASLAFAALSERWRRERVVATSFGLRVVAALVTIPFVHSNTPVIALYAVAALEGAGASAPSAVQYALLPWLASSPRQLVAANAFSSLEEVAGIMVGGGLAVILLQWGGSTGVLIAVAALGAAGGFLLLSIRGVSTSLAAGSERWPPSLVRQLSIGLEYLLHSKGPRDAVLALALPQLLSGVAQSFVSSVAIMLLHLGSAGTPLLIGCVGLGGLVGGIGSVSLASRPKLVPFLIAGLLLSATGPILVASAPKLPLTIVVLIVFGAGIALQTVATHSLLQRIVPTRMLGPVAGVTGFLNFAAMGCGAIAAAALSSLIGIRWTLFVTGLTVALMAGLVVLGMRELDRPDKTTQLAQQIVGATNLFQPLSVAVKTALARELAPLDIEPGCEVITEGEPGNDFFMIETGSYEVSISGTGVRTLGPGDSFGEIALLFDSPRTATVRTSTGGRLWRLERQAFLGALTGNAGSDQLAREIAARRRAG